MDITVLNKILDVRMQEKNEALIEKKNATDYFEKVAKELYKLLKAKEDAERTLDQIVKGNLIQKIREQSLYIEALKQKIILLQERVNEARMRMEAKQQVVTEKHMEVKKIENLIERQKLAMEEKEKLLEMKFMDEISLNQFIRVK